MNELPRLRLWSMDPVRGEGAEAAALNIDKPVVLYLGGIQDYIRRDNDQKIGVLLSNFLTQDSGERRDAQIYMVGLQEGELPRPRFEKHRYQEHARFFKERSSAYAEAVADWILPESLATQDIARRFSRITMFCFSYGATFLAQVALALGDRLRQRGVDEQDSKRWIGALAAVHVNDADAHLTHQHSLLPAASFLDFSDEISAGHLNKLGVDKRMAPLMQGMRRGARHYVVANTPNVEMRVLGINQQGQFQERIAFPQDGHSLYLDTNLTRYHPNKEIKTYQVRAYAHIIREVLDRLVVAGDDVALRGSSGIIEQVVNHYLQDVQIGYTAHILETAAKLYDAGKKTARLQAGSDTPGGHSGRLA